MSKRVSIRYLIDVAIGSPEPGVVNFNALYTVLQAITERLDIEDEEIEIDSSFNQITSNNFDSKSNNSSERLLAHQLYDNEQESKNACNKSSSEQKKSTRFVFKQDDSITEDRKISQVKIVEESKNTSSQLSKKPKKPDIKQRIDCLFDRFEKIENLTVWSADTEQSVECLRQIVKQLQEKVDSLEKIVCVLKDKRNTREEDISACRIKMDFDKLSIVTDGLRKELDGLKKSVIESGPKRIQFKASPETAVDLAEIKRIDDQLIELKTNNCVLSKKLDNIEEQLAKTDDSSEKVGLDFFEQEISTVKDLMQNLTTDIKCDLQEEFRAKFDELMAIKIDKDEVFELLSEKADYSTVHHKVSFEHMDAENRRFDKQLNEITNCVIVTEEQIQKQINDLKKLVGDENLVDMLKEFQLKFGKELQKIIEDVKKLSEIKPDADSVVTRLKDLTCLSCDQDVVMKRIELNNLAKFRDAHVSKSMNSSITYEVGKLREAGKVGLFNDDDIVFELEKKFRHSGGVHTIVSSKDRVLKTRLPKNK